MIISQAQTRSQKWAQVKRVNYYSNSENQNGNGQGTTIQWIDKLLQTPITNHRKYSIWRILAPYLLNKRQLSYNESFDIIKDWLDRCSKLERLTLNPSQKIKEGLDSATRGYYPIGLEKLKVENTELYTKLQLK